jgi:hypothetical protein
MLAAAVAGLRRRKRRGDPALCSDALHAGYKPCACLDPISGTIFGAAVTAANGPREGRSPPKSLST